MDKNQLSSLQTRSGKITFPAYIPVTTFGAKYPLDDLIRPYLPRLAQAMMVSFHYAKLMKSKPQIPVLIDSGGFAALFEGARVRKERDVGVLEFPTSEGIERVHPRDVLDFQEKNADVGFTLDFPIPPGLNKGEARLRQRATIANALWAIRNRRRLDLRLYGCIQGWDAKSYRECAKQYAGVGFDGLAIGGLIPRARNKSKLLKIVDAVRSEVPTIPIHVFGLGRPELLEQLFKAGVQSVDSSAYVKLAADGKAWYDKNLHIRAASPTERLVLALCNLAAASSRALPLPLSKLVFAPPIKVR